MYCAQYIYNPHTKNWQLEQTIRPDIIHRTQNIFLYLYTGHLEVVTLLINCGAEVTCKDKKGYTPLHAAAANGQIHIVKHLLNFRDEVSILAM